MLENESSRGASQKFIIFANKSMMLQIIINEESGEKTGIFTSLLLQKNFCKYEMRLIQK